MEGSEPVDATTWTLAELKAELVALARNGESDTLQFEKLQDRIEALEEIRESEPERMSDSQRESAGGARERPPTPDQPRS